MKNDNLEVGHKVNISTKTYQVNYNKSLKTYSSKNKKKYTDDEYSENIKNGKKTRPIVIIYNNINSNIILAVSESNSKSISQIRNNYKNKINKNIWKYELLILDKEKINFYKSSKNNEIIWEKYPENEIKDFLKSFETKKKEIYFALQKKIWLIENNII